MTDKIKSAFGSIRAEESLKDTTLRYLHDEIQRRDGKKREKGRRLAVGLATALFAICVVTGYIYGVPAAYVDIDVNPSVALTLNRFDRVIGAYAYNQDGESVLSGLSLKNESYTDAIASLMEDIYQKGYIQDGGLVSVTLQTNDTDRETTMLSDTQTCVAHAVEGQRQGISVDVFAVDLSTRTQACGHNITPAKYLAIQELMAVDPTADIAGCRGRSISAIQERTRYCQGLGMGKGRGMGNGRHMGGRGYHSGRGWI